ncbi:L-aspartate oxidase [Mobilicoccus massiliensis]|uniref:L-aspartate oxidase n=1 Tax=Mobilicoccus massiliensis TaxID=1522310 RepID=UPI0006936BFA|nr:FAD-dependent oxidoreductase [Mobilicoccus massiliensis]
MTAHTAPRVAPSAPSADVVVVGTGLAGSTTALRLAERGLRVLALSPDPDPRPGVSTSSALAQGGLAAAVGSDDHPTLHAADTVAAGAGLTDPRIAERITAAAPGVVRALLDLGAALDRTPTGELDLGLEGAHGRHRIVHAHGDGSGAEFLRAVLAAAYAHPRVDVRGSTRVTRLLTSDSPTHRVTGVEMLDLTTGEVHHVRAGSVVLATGGIGGLFAHTTNPVTSWGSGLALGVRAGARVRDLELVQFHPTALDVESALGGGLSTPGARMPLVSEAVRGEGVALVLDDGTPLPDPLAGRDVVARAVWRALRAGRKVYLDVPNSPLARDFESHFPTVHAACVAAGLEPRRDRIPVRPAAHYHMGGLAVDATGCTDMPGLRAVGEVASTGLHGANRLASNSLLEAVACADTLADDLAGRFGAAPVRPAETTPAPRPGHARPHEGPTLADRLLLEDAAGLYRDGATLAHAAEELRDGADTDDTRLVACLLTHAALQRAESRGAHQRVDHPSTTAARHTFVGIADLRDPGRTAAHLTRSAS